MRVLRLHALRAADALQLAAALEWSGSPAAGVIVSFDERLAQAAAREGFEVEAG
jgi:predicted nucleic acid-binding protein